MNNRTLTLISILIALKFALCFLPTLNGYVFSTLLALFVPFFGWKKIVLLNIGINSLEFIIFPSNLLFIVGLGWMGFYSLIIAYILINFITKRAYKKIGQYANIVWS